MTRWVWLFASVILATSPPFDSDFPLLVSRVRRFASGTLRFEVSGAWLDVQHARICTGRQDPPTSVARECVLIVGRRGGKSRILALIAVYIACFLDHRESLAPGERGVVQVLAADRRQARVILRYSKAFLAQTPLLATLIDGETQEGISVTNGIDIEVTTASFRTSRGRTVVAALLDELAFWSSEESANPDAEVLAAVKPSMLTIKNSMLLAASSPYAKKGVLYDAWRDHYAKEGDPVLVWKAATQIMNPLVDASLIAAAYAQDPARASAEYGAEWRNDVETYVTPEVIDACISLGVFERAPVSGIRYGGFVDMAGGSGKDSATLSVAHLEDGLAVVDLVREIKPPFSPEAATAEFASLLKQYGITKVLGDKFAGEFPRELFRKHGIQYDASARPKSDLYREALALFNSGQVDLIENAKLRTQLIGLERKTSRGGKDSIDHGPGRHDDLANACCGAVTTLKTRRYKYDSSMDWVSGPNRDETEPTSHVNSRLAAYLLTGGLQR